MKHLASFPLGLLLLAGCSHGSMHGSMMAESGYPTGSLALAAIERGDWATAERLLTDDPRLATDDPARLVNLGRVYMAMGRFAEALAVWRRALLAPPVEVETLGGRLATTDQLAREALDHYATQTAAR